MIEFVDEVKHIKTYFGSKLGQEIDFSNVLMLETRVSANIGTTGMLTGE